MSETDIRVLQRKTDQATFAINGTKVTFLAYPFPLINDLLDGATISGKLTGLKLAPPEEIALMKAYAIGRRASYWGYLDLYFLCKTGLVSIGYILDKAPRKFAVGNETAFSARLFLEQLVYTGDIEDQEAALGALVDQKVSSGQVEQFFRQQVRNVLRSQFGEDTGGTGQ